jgi:hypothetical protein
MEAAMRAIPRIAVDAAGDACVLDRFFNTGIPVLLKLLSASGITTSTGSTTLPILDVPPLGIINDPRNLAEIQDDRIASAKQVGVAADSGKLGWPLWIDTTGHFWVGIYSTLRAKGR